MRGRIISRLATQFLVLADKQIIICTARKNTQPLAIGDNIEWVATDNNKGVINKLHPRSNFISRPDPFNKFDKPFIANINLLLAVIAPEPEPDWSLLDEYTVLATLHAIDLVVVYNKADVTLPVEYLSLYRKLGYTCINTSIKTNTGLNELNIELKSRTGVFVGQSGVGKSSIINALLPDKNLKTQTLSDTSEGRHTTSHSTLYSLRNGGEIIDTPGVREFGLWKLRIEDIAKGFVEIYRASENCHFHNCKHLNEPKCAVKQAVKRNDISDKRYQNFVNLSAKISAHSV